MQGTVQFLFFVAHRFRFVWAAVLCSFVFFYISFHDFQEAAHRTLHLHYTQAQIGEATQNLFYGSVETEQRDDDDREPNKAHCAPTDYVSFGIFFIKKRSSDHIFIACFENEAIEEETPPPDVMFVRNPLLFIC